MIFSGEDNFPAVIKKLAGACPSEPQIIVGSNGSRVYVPVRVQVKNIHHLQCRDHLQVGIPSGFSDVTAVAASLTLLRMAAQETTDPLVLDNTVHVMALSGVTLFLAKLNVDGDVYSSTDGTSWTFLGNTGQVNCCIAFGAGLLVMGVAGGQFYTSPTGAVWTLQATTVANAFGDHGLIFAGGQFVGVTATGESLTSPDGLTWTQGAGTGGAVNAVGFGAGLYVAVGNGGDIFTSPDGDTWTPQVSGVVNNLLDVAFGNGKFVVVGQAGMVLTSSDGITWTDQSATSGTVFQIRTVAFGNGYFYYGTLQNHAGYGTDGVNWTVQDFLPTDHQFDDIIYFKDLTFVATIFVPPV